MVAIGSVISLEWVNSDSNRTNNLISKTKAEASHEQLKLDMDGGIVMDHKSGSITLHYDVSSDSTEKGLFFRDFCISKLRRTGMKTFTFKVNSVKTFESDSAGDLFSWLRLLQPGTINELKMDKIGKNTYMFSLNRHLYNVCTTSSNVEL
ncbi:hypothetical protein [Salmonella enterica]|uniref:hypothetical protein n=1 Tax=Salmonella enterica TaxID=28901 RepID=UPI00288CB9D7|nr:hypothetical protein [Salmonella enterica]MDT1790661.1 hypothetical protein [Salmonella enterica subsp. enterica serovar Oslo]